MRLRTTAAAVFAVALALPAAGSAALRLGPPDTEDYPTVRVTAVTSDVTGDPPSLRENGVTVAGFVAENLAAEKAVVIAVDRSKSMAGQTLLDAKAAARVFLRTKLAADRVALFAFGTNAGPLTGFSTSAADAYRALTLLQVAKQTGTSLYDVVGEASNALAKQDYPGRVLVVITDGENVLDTGSPEDAIAKARAAGVSVYPIGIAGPQFSPAPLQRLAQATGGAYSEASSSAKLVAVSNALTQRLRRTWRLSFETAVRPGGAAVLSASEPGQGVAKRKLSIPADADAGEDAGRSGVAKLLFDSTVGNMLAALVVGLIVLIASMCLLSAWNVRRLQRRLEAHVPSADRQPQRKPRTRFAALGGLFDATETMFGRLSVWGNLRTALERADVPLRPVELFWIMMAAGLVLGILFAALAGSAFLFALGLLVGGLAPYAYVHVQGIRRLRAFDEQLPDLLMTMAGSLRAGHTFRQALQAIVEEGNEPASKEFKRVLLETGLGRPIDQALAEMAQRLVSKNFDYVISVVAIQREVGGSLAALFDMVADTVRQRQQFLKKVKGLTAMGRMSAYVLVAMPFVVGLIMTALNPKYMAPLFTTNAGHVLILLGALGMIIGSLLLRRIVSFRIA